MSKRFALLGLLAVLVAACGSTTMLSSARATAPRQALLASHTAGLSTTTSYPSVGIRLDPPAAGMTPGIDASQAIADVCSPKACTGTDAPTRAVFVMLTDTEYARISPTGPPVPYFVNVPAWAIYWDGAVCSRQEPDRPAGAPQPPVPTGPPLFSCTRIAFVDAARGTYLESVELGGTSGLIP